MPRWVRVLLVALASMLGVAAAVVAQMAILAELVGFGGQSPRPVAVVVLAVGLLASLGVPALIARWLFPEHGGRVFIGVLAGALVATEAVLGLLWLI